MTSQYIRYRVAGIACFIFAALVIAFSIFAGRGLAVLKSRGVHTYGTVVVRGANNLPVGASYDTRQYGMTIEFPTPSTTVRRVIYVNRTTYDDHPFGSQIEVVYDPLDLLHVDAAVNLTSSRQTVEPLIAGIVIACLGVVSLVYGFKASKDDQTAAPDLDEAIERAQHPGIR
ncbi:MAG TPA: hypothetical protein VHE55_12905 [Fimbriimonadaceae bacterium]|nr:hypothetical protein [Fimbriimonadaceae bacterium]